MREEYTMTTDDNGDDRACPFRLTSDSTSCYCIGRRCMAWVEQLDNSGKPTGSGRCGMVGSLNNHNYGYRSAAKFLNGVDGLFIPGVE